jgi:hypothetical protein
MTATQEQAIEILNAAKLAADGNAKVRSRVPSMFAGASLSLLFFWQPQANSWSIKLIGSARRKAPPSLQSTSLPPPPPPPPPPPLSALAHHCCCCCCCPPQVDQLRALLELVVRKEPGLLPEFLPEVLELQVRRWVWAAGGSTAAANGRLTAALSDPLHTPKVQPSPAQPSPASSSRSPRSRPAPASTLALPLCLQVDPSPAVKRYLADFIDAALAASPCPPVLQPSLQGLQGLLADGVAATAKRALQSCYPAFRTAYTLVALRGAEAGAADALRSLWAAAQALKLAVAGVAAAPGGNDAVRMAAAKFLEQAVLLLTAEMVPAVAGVSAAPAPLPPGNAVTDKAALVRDAQALLAQLVALLKQRVGEQVSGPVAATAVRAAGGIALQRPQFLGRLLPPLLALANSGAYGVAAAAAGATDGAGQPAAGAGGGQLAVANALKAALLALARSSQTAAVPWRKKLAAALDALGAADALEPADRCSGGGAGGARICFCWFDAIDCVHTHTEAWWMPGQTHSCHLPMVYEAPGNLCHPASQARQAPATQG